MIELNGKVSKGVRGLVRGTNEKRRNGKDVNPVDTLDMATMDIKPGF